MQASVSVKMILQVGVQAYLLWEKAGKPDGADFSKDARKSLQEQIQRGATIMHLEKSLKAPSPKEPEPMPEPEPTPEAESAPVAEVEPEAEEEAPAPLPAQEQPTDSPEVSQASCRCRLLPALQIAEIARDLDIQQLIIDCHRRSAAKPFASKSIRSLHHDIHLTKSLMLDLNLLFAMQMDY